MALSNKEDHDEINRGISNDISNSESSVKGDNSSQNMPATNKPSSSKVTQTSTISPNSPHANSTIYTVSNIIHESRTRNVKAAVPIMSSKVTENTTNTQQRTSIKMITPIITKEDKRQTDLNQSITGNTGTTSKDNTKVTKPCQLLISSDTQGSSNGIIISTTAVNSGIRTITVTSKMHPKLLTSRQEYVICSPNTIVQPIILNSVLPQDSLAKQINLKVTNSVAAPAPGLKLKHSPNVFFDRSRSSSSKRIVLRDIPLKDNERFIPRKSKTAKDIMLEVQNNRCLFKCPDFDCTFASESSVPFLKHMRGHTALKNKLLPCLYCNYKTEFTNYAVHVEVKHGACRYGCLYCFYRAASLFFVNLHCTMHHSNLPKKVLSIKLNPSNLRALPSDSNALLQKLILPYLCGELSKL